MDKIYAHAKLRYVIPLFILGSIAPFVIEAYLFSDALLVDDSSIESLALLISGYVIIFFLLWFVWCRSYSNQEVFGNVPAKHDIKSLALLAIPLVALSFLTLYLVFYPLSLFHPEFVQSWVLDMPEILRPMDEAADIHFNLVNVLVIVLLAPVMEEFVFRGFLLGRLNKKLGVIAAIIVSSVIFAVLHAELLGAFIFSVFLSLIRFKYQSLLAPMIVHISNNFIVTVIVFVDQIILGNVYEYTIAEFHSLWWCSLIGVFLGVPFLVYYYQKNLSGSHRFIKK